ncbi:MAG: M48 family metalloprotease [Thermodesulfobacteriota bacterium]
MKTRRAAALAAMFIFLAWAVSACENIQQSVMKDPVAAIQSVGRIGSAALKASGEITEEQERYLGRSVSARLLTKYSLLHNASLTRYVNLVGASVAMASDRPDLPFHFAVLNTTEVNSFAAPGGYIFITYGMLKDMKDEEELAAVLAHEIGHVCARHSLQSVKSDLWKRVAVITAQETARHGGVNPELLDLFGQATDKVVGTLVTVGYSQPMEFEADKLGYTYAAKAGYDPNALRRYAEQMEQRAKGRDKNLSVILGTHPSFEARLAKLPKEGASPAPDIVKVRQQRYKSTVR